MYRQWIITAALAVSLMPVGHFVNASEEKQSYGQINGQVLNEWRKPVGGVTVTLNSQTNGYATNNLVSISDVNGNYKISHVPRYIYSKGPEPKAVEYYLTVNYPGYDLYSSETFTFENSLSTKKDIRLKSSIAK